MRTQPIKFNLFNILLENSNSIVFDYNHISYCLYSSNKVCGQKKSDIVEFTFSEVMDESFLKF